MSPIYERISLIVNRTCKDVGGVCRGFGARLTSAHRRALAGKLFPHHPLCVLAVGRALTRKARLFPDVPVDGAGLLARQGDAFGYLMLRDFGANLPEWAGDMYLRAQTEVLDDAVKVLRHVESTEGQVFGDASRRAARRRALSEAFGYYDNARPRKLRGPRAHGEKGRAALVVDAIRDWIAGGPEDAGG